MKNLFKFIGLAVCGVLALLAARTFLKNVVYIGDYIRYFSLVGIGFTVASAMELIAFGMLAHLNITSNDLTSHIEANLIKYDAKNTDSCLEFYTFLEMLKLYKNFNINPTAFPLIQRYRTAFDKYEAQMGIQNPFTKEEKDDM